MPTAYIEHIHFTGSNGIEIKIAQQSADQQVYLLGTRSGEFGGETHATASAEGIEALREFFRVQEDLRLGRWRSQLDPGWTAVVQDGSRWILFSHDDGEHAFSVGPLGENLAGWAHELREIAREYFAAHPYPEPKPWASAMVITWRDGAYLPQIAQRDPQTNGGHDKGWWTVEGQDGRWLSTEKLAALIGDAEVTVLVPETV